MVPLTLYIVLGAVLFTIGIMGVCVRRNAIVLFMCIEIMLNAVNLTFVTLSKTVGNLDGQIAVFFVMCVAAAEAAVGLAIILAVFRQFKSLQSSEPSELRQ